MIHVEDYKSTLREKIPARRLGDFVIEKTVVPKGTILRCYFPAGFLYKDTLGRNLHLTSLRESGDIWMTDDPMEQDSLRMPVMVARGDILIIGLGLGLFPEMLRKHNRKVNSITIVEKNPEVVNLVYQHIRTRKTKILRADAEEFLAETQTKFDFIYIDVWKTIIAPIKEIDKWTQMAQRCLTPNGEVMCWLQRLYDRIKDKLPKEPIVLTGLPAVYDPCLICGKRIRNDFAGLCMDCADILEVSDMYIKNEGGEKCPQ